LAPIGREREYRITRAHADNENNSTLVRVTPPFLGALLLTKNEELFLIISH
jgi:hypothetical protein